MSTILDAGRQPQGRSRRRHRGTRPAAAVAIAMGLVGVLAPASFTGDGVVDGFERALVVAAVSFVGAHGRRWAWLVAGALAAVSARGPALAFVTAGLAVSVAGAWPRRRPKSVGALATGLMMNGLLWYQPDDLLLIPVAVATAAVLIVIWSGFGELRRRYRRTAVWTGLATLALATVAIGLAAATAWSVRADVDDGTSAARRALAAIRSGDTDRARIELAQAERHLTAADRRLSGAAMKPIGGVPGAAQQARAVRVSIDAARRVTLAADALVATNYEDLRYEGRIDLVEISRLRPPSLRVEASLAQASADLDEVTAPMLLPPLRDRIDEFAREVRGARDDADFAADALDVAPRLLGGDGPRHYLVVFVTPAELRGAGGFVGNWIELEAADGDVSVSRSGRIAELLDAAPKGTRTLTGPADYVARYGRLDPTDNLQDATFSPNWPSDASVLSQLYPQSGGRPVDGVFGVDPSGVAALLELTGPVAVEGLDMALDANNAVEFLTTGQYERFPDRSQRADVLDASIRATFDALTSASLPSPRRLGDVLGPAARARHLQLWSPDRAEQQFFERMKVDGTVAIPRGQDGLSLVQQNAGNNKLDAYLRRRVRYQAGVDPTDATISATVTVTLRNEVPRLDLEPAVVGNARGVPIGTNLTSLSLFTPHTVRAASIDGAPVTLAPDRELGLQVWDTPLLAIPPGGEVTVVYELVGVLDLRDGYRFRYFPQPLAVPEELTVDITAADGHFAGSDAALRFQGPAAEPIYIRRRISR